MSSTSKAISGAFTDPETQQLFNSALRFRHAGALSAAVTSLEQAIEREGDSDVLWGELALAQFLVWQQYVCNLHKAGILNAQADASELGGGTLGGRLLQAAYNVFIIAMEYPSNKKNPVLLIKFAMLYIEFRSYRGALSVCTLLIEGYAQSAVLPEAIFLSALSANALGKHLDCAQYFQYLSERPPFRLPGHYLHLLAALELEKVDGMRDHMREEFNKAYKVMIGQSPITRSEKTAHANYKSSRMNESQRVHAWYQDDWTWFDMSTRLTVLNFPLLARSVLDVVRKRNQRLPTEMLLIEGVSRYRVGEAGRGVEILAEALCTDYWSDHLRFLLRCTSANWKTRFELEMRSASVIQSSVKKFFLRLTWRSVMRGCIEARRNRMTVTIQCGWRQYVARSTLSDLRVQRRKREVAENESMALSDMLVIMKRLNAAARVIQSLHAIFIAKREARVRSALRDKHNRIVSLFALQRRTAGTRQALSAWRRFVVLQQRERAESASSIQRQARKHLSRKIYKRLRLAKERQDRIVVLCLDRRVGSVMARVMREWKQYALERRELKHRVSGKIQQCWHRYLARKRYRTNLRRHLIATDLMNQMLAEKTMRKMRSLWNVLSSNALWQRMRKRRAAVVIQKHARGVITRRCVRKLRARRRRLDMVIFAMRQRSAAQILRRVFEALVHHVEMLWAHRTVSVQQIQRIYRGFRARKRVRFLKECSRILGTPGMTLRGQPDAYVKRVCFLLLARLPEQNRMAIDRVAVKIQRWYRRGRKRRQLVVALAKLRKQRAILATLQANFRFRAVLFFKELQGQVRAKRWRRDHAASRIQRAARQWIMFLRFSRVVSKRESKKARAAERAHFKGKARLRLVLTEWLCTLRTERAARADAVTRIQRAYRARVAKRDAQRIVSKRAARQRLVESIHLKPVERCFRQWEGLLLQKSVLTVRSATKTASVTPPEKWKTIPTLGRASRDRLSPTRSPHVPSLEERAEIPSLVFYTHLNRVRQSGTLQLSLSTGVMCTTNQLQQLLALSTNVIVDGGGVNLGSGLRLVEHVIDAMESSTLCPAKRLILYNSAMDTAHAATLSRALRSPIFGVTSLVLSNIRLGSAGVMTLATALCYGHSRLEQLVLECCGVGSAGAAALAEGLCHSRLLWKLDLSQNTGVSDSVCPVLCHALLTSSSLRVLVLSETALSDRGVLAFLAPTLARAAEAVAAQQSQLELVVVRRCVRISARGREALKRATIRFAPTRPVIARASLVVDVD